jgi:hypothetical protein
MSYIGTPPSNAFTSLLKQDFSTSATTGYTLDHAVNNANDIALFINFVRQEPTAGYAASGTTLTLTSATASSDDMYCVYLGQALQTVNPPNASVGAAQLIDASITSAKLGTDAKNTPAFHAILSSDQSIAHNTTTTILFDSEVFDTDSAYDTSTGKFTPQTAGKYYIYTVLRNDGTGTYEVNTRITKNGSDVVGDNVTDNEGSASSVTFTTVDLNGSSDYVIITIYQPSGGAKNIVGSATDRTYFGGYKIIE